MCQRVQGKWGLGLREGAGLFGRELKGLVFQSVPSVAKWGGGMVFQGIPCSLVEKH